MTTIFTGEALNHTESAGGQPHDEVATLEHWLKCGHMPEDTVFDAESARQALENIRSIHFDDTPFKLTDEAIIRCTELDGDSYSVNTILIPANLIPDAGVTDTGTETIGIDLTQLSALGERVLGYVRLGIDNLEESEWEEIERQGVVGGLEDLCLALRAKGLDPLGIVRLGLVADSIGLKLPRVAREPIAFIKEGNMGRGSGGKKASY